MPCPEGSFLAPEIGILFGDAVGASLVGILQPMNTSANSEKEIGALQAINTSASSGTHAPHAADIPDLGGFVHIR